MYGDECERLNGTESLESEVNTSVLLVARAHLICREIKNYKLPTPDTAAGSIWPPSGILCPPPPPLPFVAGPKRRADGRSTDTTVRRYVRSRRKQRRVVCRDTCFGCVGRARTCAVRDRKTDPARLIVHTFTTPSVFKK